MFIKYLVLGGGGVAGLNMYGAIKNMIEKKYLDFDNIEKIYCVSVGALVGVIFSLKLENNIIHDYLIKRPWHKYINIKPYNILNIWGYIKPDNLSLFWIFITIMFLIIIQLIF